MKTKFNILSASLVGIVCASIMTPLYAASSVRSLGGAGTYTGTSSVRAHVASETSGSAISTARAGSLRVNNAAGTRSTNASLRTPSTRSSTAPRLSIGKYLAGSSALAGGSSKPVVPGGAGSGSDVDLSGIEADIAQLQDDLSELMGATDVRVEYNEETGELIIKHGNDVFSANLVDQNALLDLEERLNEKIGAAGVEYVGDNEYISIGENNTVSAIVGALENGALTKGLATGEAVTGFVQEYAIPKPDASCLSDSTICVLSVDMTGNYFWLELVDEPATPTVMDTVEETVPTTETYESDLVTEPMSDL